MNETERKIANINDQRTIPAGDEHDVFPRYCMIAPDVDEVLDNKDDTTVCSNRS